MELEERVSILEEEVDTANGMIGGLLNILVNTGIEKESDIVKTLLSLYGSDRERLSKKEKNESS